MCQSVLVPCCVYTHSLSCTAFTLPFFTLSLSLSLLFCPSHSLLVFTHGISDTYSSFSSLIPCSLLISPSLFFFFLHAFHTLSLSLFPFFSFNFTSFTLFSILLFQLLYSCPNFLSLPTTMPSLSSAHITSIDRAHTLLPGSRLPSTLERPVSTFLFCSWALLGSLFPLIRSRFGTDQQMRQTASKQALCSSVRVCVREQEKVPYQQYPCY